MDDDIKEQIISKVCIGEDGKIFSYYNDTIRNYDDFIETIAFMFTTYAKFTSSTYKVPIDILQDLLNERINKHLGRYKDLPPDQLKS